MMWLAEDPLRPCAVCGDPSVVRHITRPVVEDPRCGRHRLPHPGADGFCTDLERALAAEVERLRAELEARG